MKSLLIGLVLVLSGCSTWDSLLQVVGAQADTITVEVTVLKDGVPIGTLVCRKDSEKGVLVDCEPKALAAPLAGPTSAP